MFRWFGRNSTPTTVDVGERPINDEGNDSDVSLLIANDDNESSVTDVVVLPQNEQNSQSTRQVAALPRVEVVNTQPVEVSTPNVAESSRGRDEHSRRRRRHHHRHRSSSNRRRDRSSRIKNTESNFFSAIFNLIVVVLTCVAMFEPRWLHIQGGQCTNGKNIVSYLGIKIFFEPDNGHTDPFYYGSSQALFHCVTPDITGVMRVIIALCFGVLLSSLTACILDIVGSSRVVLKVIRSTASLSILSVCLCIVITGMCYLATQQLTAFYEANRLHPGSRVLVEFDIGFYMITAAGAVSVIAVGSTLMQVYSPTAQSAARGWSHDALWDTVDGRHDQQLLDADSCRATCVQATPVLPPPYQP